MWSQSLADNFFVESKLCKYICFLWRQVCADKEVVCVFNQTCADMFLLRLNCAISLFVESDMYFMESNLCRQFFISEVKVV